VTPRVTLKQISFADSKATRLAESGDEIKCEIFSFHQLLIPSNDPLEVAFPVSRDADKSTYFASVSEILLFYGIRINKN
jgi:hypothetical protein